MSSPEPLLTQFYRHATHTDVHERAGDVKQAIATSVRTLAEQRPPGEAAVRVFNPVADQDGWSVRHTVIEVVTDDMPFLVDSVLGELQRSALTVHQLIHPQMRVQPEPDERDGALESWMYLEVDRITEATQREDLAERLAGVLRDVRAAVEDWKPMRQRCREIIAELRREVPDTVDPASVEPTIDFLSWLENNHFTFLGYREYVLEEQGGEKVLRSRPETGLGILRPREGEEEGTVSELRPEAQQSALDPRLLTITKANSRATVHRSVYLDYIGVREFDEAGTVVAERRFLGLFTNSAYSDSVTRLPIISDKVAQILQRSGYAPDSHSGKDLMGVLENYPRDELFQADLETLTANATEVLFLQERRAARLFLRKDEFGRFVSALVYLPRDRFTTAVRLRMEQELARAFDAESIDYTTRVGDSALAQIHYLLRMPRGGSIPQVDEAALETALIEASRSWEERLLEALHDHFADEDVTGDVWAKYAAGFPEGYKEDFDTATALRDLELIRSLETRTAKGMPLRVYEPAGARPGARRMKIYRDSEITLTEVLPVFSHMGVKVIDERPYRIAGRDGRTRYIYDFGLRVEESPEVWGPDFADSADVDRLRKDFEDAFAAVWSRDAESDSLNALVLTADLKWRDVVILRTVVRYLRQVGTFSLDYLEEALVANPSIARLVVELFQARLHPDTPGDRDEAAEAIREKIAAALDEVSSLDQDRIIRSVVEVVQATLRTNFYRVDEDGSPKPHVSLKLDPRAIEGLPEPRPAFEIWVYAPRVEGVHLRFGAVARGGLRWSDRREDFRTEVLGLVKAQMVKNAVIVPTGSKGGFVAKNLPDPSVDREAWLNEGIGCYRIFIKGMLDLTDNRVDGEIVPPDRVVRHDGDDPYLVVAADKGTATFSDIANGVSADYGFWLDDAFASGGSAGYDHKAMGITARGAWESVKRHFRELGLDTQTQEFTVVGVGDMSGDVFGNGMLLSEHIRLVAAFDHRHIFIDPDPDAATSFAERRRLFELPRSSWADYDESLISAGGGVYPRSAKSITLSREARTALGLPGSSAPLAPSEVLTAILKAPVDLFWNGGIGTYVKAIGESHSEIGDRANDGIRVNGADLRVRVVGEGGNLGMSQLGRIEAAENGVHLNTDAIDNSAGVDSSDHEVNIKIALAPLVRSGEMSREDRDALLASMTDDVAAKVLRHNYEQNVLIGNARYQKGGMASVHRRLMNALGEQVSLDRVLEFLPDDAELSRREEEGWGLTSPEFSVLLAYAKLAVKDALLNSDLPDEEYLNATLAGYFPAPLAEAVGDGLDDHPLRREIIVNELANGLVNRGGVTFAFRAQEETGATIAQIARSFVICREVFRMADFVAAVEALDSQVPTDLQTELYLEFRRLMDRGVRWFLNNQSLSASIPDQIARFSDTVTSLTPQMGTLLCATERERWQDQADGLVKQGLSEELAQWYASLLDSYSLLDVVELADEAGVDHAQVAELYFATSERFRVDTLLTSISELPREDRWSSLARGAARDEMYGVLRALTRTILVNSKSTPDPKARIDQWAESNAQELTRVRQVLSSVTSLDAPGLAAVSVALRTLRGLVRQGTAG